MLVWPSNSAVCCAVMVRLETSRMVPGPVLSAIVALAPPPVLVFAEAAAPATRPPLPEIASAKVDVVAVGRDRERRPAALVVHHRLAEIQAV